MSEIRRTNIIEEEIEDLSNIDSKEIARDEIFEQFKLALLESNSTRLLGKFYKYCNEYVNFEYDESAMNMDEADDVLRKTNILRDKLVEYLEDTLSCTFEDIKTNTVKFQISFKATINEIKYTIIIEVFPDSFDLEIL